MRKGRGCYPQIVRSDQETVLLQITKRTTVFPARVEAHGQNLKAADKAFPSVPVADLHCAGYVAGSNKREAKAIMWPACQKRVRCSPVTCALLAFQVDQKRSLEDQPVAHLSAGG